MGNTKARLQSGSSLREQLLRRENLDLIEEVLGETREEYLRLDDMRSKGDRAFSFSEPLSYWELPNYSRVVQRNVEIIFTPCKFKPLQVDYEDTHLLKSRLLTSSGLIAPIVAFGAGVLTTGPLAFLAVATGVVSMVKKLDDWGLSETLYTGDMSAAYARGRAIFKRLPKETVVPLIGHEFAHHMQKLLVPPENYPSISDADYAAFEEGHAYCVQGHVAETWAKVHGNEAYKYKLQEARWDCMSNAYELSCKNNGREAREDIVMPFEMRKGMPAHYSVGLPFFMLLERQEGKSIHRDVLTGKKSMTLN